MITLRDEDTIVEEELNLAGKIFRDGEEFNSIVELSGEEGTILNWSPKFK